MMRTAKDLHEANTTIDDPEVRAFVEYLDWMKSVDYTDLLRTSLSYPDNPGSSIEMSINQASISV